MKRESDAAVFADQSGPLVLAAGFFDGVHRGHQRVIEQAMRCARAKRAEAWVLTFDRHPMAALCPERRPPLLTPLPQRLECLEATGIDGCLTLPFTRELADTSPHDFVHMLCGDHGAVSDIMVGSNWRFGKRAAGSPELMAAFGHEYGFVTHIAESVLFEGAQISSTRIRQAIQAGDCVRANRMLGRAYSIRETVVRGRGVGRTLGMATANVHPDAEVLPPFGVYVVRATVAGRTLNGVANLGVRPTFPDAPPDLPVLELHLFDFEGELYGQTLDVAFIERLRDELRFESPEAMMAQVRRDIDAAKACFAGGAPTT